MHWRTRENEMEIARLTTAARSFFQQQLHGVRLTTGGECMNDTAQNVDAGKPPPDFAIIPRHIWLDRSLTNADRAVYDALAAHAGGQDNRECFPGTERIVAVSGVAAGTVSKSVSWLIARGHIERWKGPREMPDGRQAMVTNYRLAWSNESEATSDDRAAFFQGRHPSRRARDFPSVEISSGGNSTGGNQRHSTGGNPEVSTREIEKFPYGETQENRPARTNHSEQTRYNNTHTAHAAASQTASDRIEVVGVPIEALAGSDGRVRLKAGMAAPDFVFKQHRYRVGLGKTAWMSAPRQLREAVWQRFLEAKAGKDWAAVTVSGEFTKWVREQMGHRLNGTPNNPDPLWREFDKLKAPPPVWQPKSAPPPSPPPAPPPVLHIIGNMKQLPWTDSLSKFLENEDRYCEWLKWTIEHHNKKMSDLDAQRSWAKWATNRRQYLARQELDAEIPF